MTSKVITGPGRPLMGSAALNRLKLNAEIPAFCFDGKECDGVIQARVSVRPESHRINDLPFLPIRVKGQGGRQVKSFRVSCYTCLRLRRKDLCPHDLEERSFRGVFTMSELAYAVARLGYVLMEVESALVYPGLEFVFKEFMQLFASRKICCEGLPAGWEPEAYCQGINDAMGFTGKDRVTPDKLAENGYEKSAMKAVLNFSIGKLSQRPSHPVTEFVRNQSRLAEIFADPSLEVSHAFLIDPEVLQVKYEKKQSFLPASRKTQSVINAIITGKARAYLDSQLRLLIEDGHVPLYSDTDSVVIKSPKNSSDPLLKHPAIFGQWKSEVAEDGYILRFMALSAKNYAYEVADARTGEVVARVTKIRGLTLKGAVAEAMSPELLLHFVRELAAGRTVRKYVPQFTLKIDGVEKTIEAVEIQKMYSNVCNEKRFFRPDVDDTKLWAYGVTQWRR